jgi:alpha-N-arabinofuranosidase
VPLELKSPDYAYGYTKIPAVSASASRDKAGKIHVSLVNDDPKNAVPVSAKLSGVVFKTVTGEILTAPEMNARNTFEKPDAVKPAAFTGAKLEGDTLKLELPAKSVLVLELQ